MRQQPETARAGAAQLLYGPQLLSSGRDRLRLVRISGSVRRQDHSQCQRFGDAVAVSGTGAVVRPIRPNQCAYDAASGPAGQGFPNTAVGTLAGDPVASGNAAVAGNRLGVLTCPDDAGEPYIYGSYGSQNNLPAAKTNYDFCVDFNELWACNLWKRPDAGPTYQTTRRIFGQGSACHVADITDGTSNTIAMGETTYDVRMGSCAAWGYQGWTMVGVDPTGWEAYGINWWGAGAIPDPAIGMLAYWGQMGSLHLGGANAVFADGSVHFLNEDTDLTMLQHLAAMADGELVTVP